MNDNIDAMNDNSNAMNNNSDAMNNNSNTTIASSASYKARRKQQMLRFFGGTLLTLLSFRLLLKQLATPKYIPRMFQQNAKRAPGAVKSTVGASLAGTLGVTTGGLLMLGTGYCWTADVSSMSEFKAKLAQQTVPE